MTAPTPPAAEATPATEAAPAIVPPGQVWSLAEEAPAPEAVVSIGEGSKQAIASQSETLAEVVGALDKWALTFGDIRVSLFDVLLVVATIALVITVAWTLTRVARKLLRNVSHFDEAQKVLAEKLVTVLIWTLAFFIAVDMVGIDLTALAFFGGAFGLAIGFGLQKTFGNLI